MGKTAKMMKCAVENAKVGNAVGIISAEMSAVQLVTRAVAIDTSKFPSQLTKKKDLRSLNTQKLSGHKHRMKDYPTILMIRQVLILEGFLQPLRM
jgi:replicative DNA helicase